MSASAKRARVTTSREQLLLFETPSNPTLCGERSRDLTDRGEASRDPALRGVAPRGEGLTDDAPWGEAVMLRRP